MYVGSMSTVGFAVIGVLLLVGVGPAAEGSSGLENNIQNTALPFNVPTQLRLRSPLSGGSLVEKAAPVLMMGSVAAYLSQQFEDPDRMARLLDNSALEVPTDVGDIYGDAITLGCGTLGVLLMGHLTGSPALEEAGGDLFRTLVLCTSVVWSVKVAANRTRPNGGKHSFPSGHTAAAFSVAPVLHKHFGAKVAVPAYALALSTGLGRMEDRKHYLSDVLLGAFTGFVVGDAIANADNSGKLAEHISIGPRHASLSLDF